MKKSNSILVVFSSYTNFINFKKAEKLDKKEIWKEDDIGKSMVIPIYMLQHVKDSDYVERHSEIYTNPPKHTERTDDLDLPEVEIAKCP